MRAKAKKKTWKTCVKRWGAYGQRHRCEREKGHKGRHVCGCFCWVPAAKKPKA